MRSRACSGRAGSRYDQRLRTHGFAFILLAGCGRIGFGERADSGISPAIDAAPGGDASRDSAIDAPAGVATWQVAPTPPTTTSDLWAAWAFAPNDLWVAGTLGAIQHFDGTGWTTTSSAATNTLFVFWGAAPNDIWLVGRSCTALRWAGTAWNPTTIPGCSGNQDLFSIEGTSTTNIWATGTMGNLQQYTGAWANRSVANIDYWDAHVTSATDAIAIGTLGTIEHWNGSVMTAETSGVTVTLAAIASPAPGEYWVVGGGGTILHGVGGSWTPVTSPTTAFLYAVLARGTSDVWAVGSGGVIVHYDGASWTTAQSPTTNTLRNLQAVPGGGLIAVGDAGTLLVHP